MSSFLSSDIQMPVLPSDFAVISDQLFGALLIQHARLITLETAQGSDLPDTLMIESFSGTEAINDLFCFEIDALSLSTTVDLKQFIGE
jgi:type VI secretion system secreted protein VgrG